LPPALRFLTEIDVVQKLFERLPNAGMAVKESPLTKDPSRSSGRSRPGEGTRHRLYLQAIPVPGLDIIIEEQNSLIL